MLHRGGGGIRCGKGFVLMSSVNSEGEGTNGQESSQTHEQGGGKGWGQWEQKDQTMECLLHKKRSGVWERHENGVMGTMWATW